MKYNKLEKNVACFGLFVSIFTFTQSEVFAGSPEDKCETVQCLKEKAKLEELGYEAVIAERLAVFRPDLTRLITSPEIIVNPGQFMNSMSSEHASNSPEWFESQVQARSPITVYRGMTFKDKEKFDPTYFYKGDIPFIDPRIFTSDSLEVAFKYASSSDRNGLLLKMQIPKFMLYQRKPGPYGLVYFRDVVPHDLTFVSGIAIIPPKNGNFDESLKEIEFKSLSHASSMISQTPMLREERIGADGKFLPTRSWADSICQITKHALFKGFTAKVSKQEDIHLAVSSMEGFRVRNEQDAHDLLVEQTFVAEAIQIVLKSPVKSLMEADQTELDMSLGMVKDSSLQCLNARNMWLKHKIEQLKQTPVKAPSSQF